jgi:hypothetical protein
VIYTLSVRGSVLCVYATRDGKGRRRTLTGGR